MFDERNQIQKTVHLTSFVWCSRKGKTTVIERISVIAEG